MILKDNIKRMKEGSDYEAETTVDLLLDSANTIENKAQEELTRYNDPRLNKYIQDVIDMNMRFYDIMANDTRYGVNKNTYIYWKKNPGTGKYFREFIGKTTLLKKLIHDRQNSE